MKQLPRVRRAAVWSQWGWTVSPAVTGLCPLVSRAAISILADTNPGNHAQQALGLCVAACGGRCRGEGTRGRGCGGCHEAGGGRRPVAGEHLGEWLCG